MTILQRSEGWFADRCGKVTASRIKDIGAKPVKGKKYNVLTLTILSERITGVQEETPTSKAMQWGIDQEENAIAAYENETGNFVKGTGLIDHPVIKLSGASPDGLVNLDGQIEVKCPSTATHFDNWVINQTRANYKTTSLTFIRSNCIRLLIDTPLHQAIGFGFLLNASKALSQNS